MSKAKRIDWLRCLSSLHILSILYACWDGQLLKSTLDQFRQLFYTDDQHKVDEINRYHNSVHLQWLPQRMSLKNSRRQRRQIIKVGKFGKTCIPRSGRREVRYTETGMVNSSKARGRYLQREARRKEEVAASRDASCKSGYINDSFQALSYDSLGLSLPMFCHIRIYRIVTITPDYCLSRILGSSR